MSVLQANCPSCAGPIEFKAGSTIVIICPFCRSAVARTDRSLEDLGKVAEIAESESPLKVGLKGMYKDQRFELTGRAQLRHQLGGNWDEWYATFSNGWVGWLAEAQGKFYLTFYQPLPEGVRLPSFTDLQLGQVIEGIPGNVMVAEKGTATSVAAEGEIPYKLTPGEQSDYADLAGKGNVFGTIDYGVEPAWVFLGNQVSLEEIGLGDAKSFKREPKRTSAAGMGCPNCGGPLELNAPDKAERVACPYCNSLLDVNQGNLTYLHALTPAPEAQQFVLPLGAEGVFKDDVRFKIIGAVIRSVRFDLTYYWHEYLLYNPMIGFRWLVHSDNHWNFVEPINPAEVIPNEVMGMIRSVTYNGRNYKIFQDAPATVEYVTGEFYWRVEQGEVVRAMDFISAPMMLSQETTQNEMNWSAGVYMTNAEIEKAFNVQDLPKPWSVAPNQPFTGRFYYTWGALPLLLLFVVAIFMLPFTGATKTVFTQKIELPPSTGAEVAQTVFSQPFELKGGKNVRLSASAPNINNNWVSLDVDLVNEQNNDVESIPVAIEYYSGSDSDGAWTEGGRESDVTVSSLPAGKYTMRVEGTWGEWQKPQSVDLKVEQGVNRGVNFICAFIILLIVPIVGLIRKASFEGSRWKDSMFNASGGTSDSGGD